MKKRVRKTQAVLAIVLSAAVMLSGCGGIRTENDDRADALSYEDAT